MLSQRLKVALIQCKVTADKAANLAAMKSRIIAAAENGAQLIVLPECWNSPYAVTAFASYAETIPGPTSRFLSDMARETKTFLVGGSFPESEDGNIYNTSLTYSPSGELLGKHRKVHLFDVDVPGKIRFIESETLSPGNSTTLIDLAGYGKIGIGICYDIRFPELSMIAARQGAFALVYPGAFNTTTGPMHWKLLARARAVDNQVYMIQVSPARDLSSSYHAYGHSEVIDPWGKVLVEAEEGEEILYTELDPQALTDVRESIPVSKQRRFDVYKDVAS